MGKNLPAHHYHQAMSKSQEGSRASTAENYELPLEVCQYDPAPTITRLCVSFFRTLNSWKRKPKWHSVHSCSRQLCCGIGLLEGGLYYREVLRGQTVVRRVGASKSVYHIPLIAVWLSITSSHISNIFPATLIQKYYTPLKHSPLA